MKTNTSNRLKQIMSERSLKQVDILNLSIPFQKKYGIKLSKSTLSQYVNGVQSPDQNRIYLLAKTLGVSEAWLMGFDVPMLEIENSNSTTSLVEEITKISSKLEEPRQKIVLDTAHSQFKEQKEEEKKNANVIPIKKKKLTDEELWDVIEHGVASDGSEQTEYEKQFFFNLLREKLDNDDSYED
ncbi:helix-turn-helix domain-containing protein [Lactococcus garvieae]|uniref:helix-turn-helix domain-containing protein n=1 Tax=Lactococcus TaxID=1357 RepID=UPI001A93994C|nr:MULTISPECIES: helix-turn-helix domain-containing protein [Lactococcus]MCG3096750.1 helix-turn-helix domain-containing protein [Lactococcus petauri]QSQ98968.1 helix-turn-helix domain-containing protein [Lactococcus garvieae]